MKHILPACLGMLLLALALWTVFLPDPDEDSALPAITPVMAGTIQPVTESRDARAEALQVVTARPLFRADRRPSAVPAPTGGAMPVLTGIVVTPEGRRAIFADSTTSRSQALRVGDRIGRIQVQDIGIDTVVINADGDLVRVGLGRKRSPAATLLIPPGSGTSVTPPPPHGGVPESVVNQIRAHRRPPAATATSSSDGRSSQQIQPPQAR